MPIASIVFYSLVVSVIFQSFIFLSGPIRRGIPSVRGFLIIFVLSVFAAINSLTYFYSYSYTSISNAVFTHYIAPVVVMLIAPIFLKEKITLAAVFSITIASGGLWIIMRDVSVMDIAAQLFSPDSTTTAAARFRPDTIGILCGLASGVAYGAVIVILKIISGQYNKYVVVFFQNLFMAVLIAPFAGPIPRDAGSLMIIAVIGLFYSTVATYLYFSGISYVRANKAAILGYIEPIGAILLGGLLMAELPERLSVLGGALIIAAGYIIIKKG